MANIPPPLRKGDTFGYRNKAGQLILDARSARWLNDFKDELRRLGRVSAVAPLRWDEDPAGRRFSIDLPAVLPAKLSGAGAPYSWTEQVFTPGTGWADRTGGQTGANAYEYNGVSGLAGKVVELEYFPTAGDWRFQRNAKAPHRGGCPQTIRNQLLLHSAWYGDWTLTYNPTLTPVAGWRGCKVVSIPAHDVGVPGFGTHCAAADTAWTYRLTYPPGATAPSLAFEIVSSGTVCPSNSSCGDPTVTAQSSGNQIVLASSSCGPPFTAQFGQLASNQHLPPAGATDPNQDTLDISEL